MRIGAVARIHSALAVRFQEFEIAFDGSSHRQWPCNATGRPRTEHHARASLVLRLRETEDDRPVGITKVVCDADLLHYVAPAADVVACDPCSCDSGPSLAAFQPAVADMQARLEQPVVWLAPAGETASALSALSRASGVLRAIVHVQQMSNIRVRIPQDKHAQISPFIQHAQRLPKQPWTSMDASASLSRRKQGPSPLGSANDFSILAPKTEPSGRHLQLFSNGRG